MKALTTLALAAVLLTTAVAARAEWVSGYTRSNGTYVSPYYRTHANGSVYDNLSYRGYPSQQPSYVSPRNYSYGDCCSTPRAYSGTSTGFENTTYHNYRSSYGNSLSGSTTRYGNSSFTDLSGW